MSESSVIVCGTCGTLNRVPAARLSEQPKCGKCGNALVAGAAQDVDAAMFDKLVGRGDQPVLVDFWADWCQPCKMMAPQFAAAAAELDPRVRLVKVDTERQQSLAARHGIQSIPTMVLFARGREVARQSGAMNKASILRWVDAALRGAAAPR